MLNISTVQRHLCLCCWPKNTIATFDFRPVSLLLLLAKKVSDKSTNSKIHIYIISLLRFLAANVRLVWCDDGTRRLKKVAVWRWKMLMRWPGQINTFTELPPFITDAPLFSYPAQSLGKKGQQERMGSFCCDLWTFGLLNKFIQNYMREFQKICSESNLIHQHWEESEQIFLAL
jgi:hypothetical protein